MSLATLGFSAIQTFLPAPKFGHPGELCKPSTGSGSTDAPAVSVHGRNTEPRHQPVIHYHAHGRAHYGQQLAHLCQVDMVAVLDLEGLPVERVNVVRHFAAFAVPVFDLFEYLPPVLLAAEGQ